MMSHVVTEPTAPFKTRDGRLEIHQVTAWQDNLIWLAVCTETGDAAAVDGPEAGPALDYCAARGFRLTTILNTHIHGDHIGINRDLKRRGLLDATRVVGAQKTASKIPGLTEAVSDGDLVQMGGATGRVLLTEGHINGHISYVFDDVLFCGDTLFAGGCGYLFDGPPATMHASLTRLAELPLGTRVCCAHEYTQDNLRFAWSVEPDNEDLRDRIVRAWAIRAMGGCTVPSTIGEERATNPFLRTGSPTLLKTVQAAWPDRALTSAAEIFAATRALKDTKAYRETGDEELPL